MRVDFVDLVFSGQLARRDMRPSCCCCRCCFCLATGRDGDGGENQGGHNDDEVQYKALQIIGACAFGGSGNKWQQSSVAATGGCRAKEVVEEEKCRHGLVDGREVVTSRNGVEVLTRDFFSPLSLG